MWTMDSSPRARACSGACARIPRGAASTGETEHLQRLAPEQLVMTDPRGRGGALVPLSTVDRFKPGEGIGGPRGAGRGGPRVIQGAELTPAGEKGAEQFAVLFDKNNPRMRCETTSIIFDWAFDGPVNRITQNRDTIVLQYGSSGSRGRFT